MSDHDLGDAWEPAPAMLAPDATEFCPHAQDDEARKDPAWLRRAVERTLAGELKAPEAWDARDAHVCECPATESLGLHLRGECRRGVVVWDGTNHLAGGVVRRGCRDPEGGAAPLHVVPDADDRAPQRAGLNLLGQPVCVLGLSPEERADLARLSRRPVDAQDPEDRARERALWARLPRLAGTGYDVDMAEWLSGTDEGRAAVLDVASRIYAQEAREGVRLRVSWSGGPARGRMHLEWGELPPEARIPELLDALHARAERICRAAGVPTHLEKDPRTKAWVDLVPLNHRPGNRGRLWRPLGGLHKDGASRKALALDHEPGAVSIAALAPDLEAARLRAARPEGRQRAARARRHAGVPTRSGTRAELEPLVALLGGFYARAPRAGHGDARLAFAALLLGAGLCSEDSERAIRDGLGNEQHAARAVATTRDRLEAGEPCRGAAWVEQHAGAAFVGEVLRAVDRIPPVVPTPPDLATLAAASSLPRPVRRRLAALGRRLRADAAALPTPAARPCPPPWQPVVIPPRSSDPLQYLPAPCPEGEDAEEWEAREQDRRRDLARRRRERAARARHDAVRLATRGMPTPEEEAARRARWDAREASRLRQAARDRAAGPLVRQSACRKFVERVCCPGGQHELGRRRPACEEALCALCHSIRCRAELRAALERPEFRPGQRWRVVRFAGAQALNGREPLAGSDLEPGGLVDRWLWEQSALGTWPALVLRTWRHDPAGQRMLEGATVCMPHVPGLPAERRGPTRADGVTAVEHGAQELDGPEVARLLAWDRWSEHEALRAAALAGHDEALLFALRRGAGRQAVSIRGSALAARGGVLLGWPGRAEAREAVRAEGRRLAEERRAVELAALSERDREERELADEQGCGCRGYGNQRQVLVELRRTPEREAEHAHAHGQRLQRARALALAPWELELWRGTGRAPSIEHLIDALARALAGRPERAADLSDRHLAQDCLGAPGAGPASARGP